MAKMFTACPKCGCEDFELDDWYYDEDECTRDVECKECSFMWTWNYKFSGNLALDGSPLDKDGNEIENVELKPLT